MNLNGLGKSEVAIIAIAFGSARSHFQILFNIFYGKYARNIPKILFPELKNIHTSNICYKIFKQRIIALKRNGKK